LIAISKFELEIHTFLTTQSVVLFSKKRTTDCVKIAAAFLLGLFSNSINLNLMDRRNFLKNSSVAGVGILTSKSLHANDKKSIRVGFIGVGLRGRNHLSIALRRNDVEVVAICDTQEDSLAQTRNLIKKF